ncbi:hypothetical protein LTR85_006593 [Meristemomyces frigidus]|nr:hypothetical protein LTR85_006593 [Meristemomyces frigidus]
MVANERRSAGWDYPTNEMLEDLVKGEKPVLKIDALQLRLLRVKGNNRWRTAQQSGDCNGLDWLPHPSDDLHLPCQVSVNVVDTLPGKRSIYTHSLQATVSRRQNTDGGYFYDIKLDKPFLIELDKLFVATESGTNGSRHWKRTVTTKHNLDVTVRCQDSEDTAELLSKLESADPSRYNEAPANEGVLRVVWTELPQCPSTGQLLGMKRARGHKSLDLDYGMDISMGWARRKDSPLGTYSRKRFASGRQLPTPSASDDQEAVKVSQYMVRYTFQQGAETRATTQADLSCIWCQSVAQDAHQGSRPWYDKSSLPCRSLDRLRLHYMMCHDHFKTEVGEIVSVDGKQLVSIAVTLTDKQSSLPALEKPALEEYSWTAPQRPFDISAHVAGDESWVGGTKAKQKRGPGRPAKPREDTEPGATAVPMVSRKRPALDEVLDLPPPKRKKYKVPDDVDVTFYHNLSKQEIQPGEELSESDDEMYDDRLVRSQRRNFTELGLSETACEFHQAFNRHVDAEQSSSTTLVKDALVRFARRHQAKLWDHEWRHAFDEKLKHLEMHGVISADVVATCLNRQLSAADEKPDEETGAARKSVKADAEMPDDDYEDHDSPMNGDEQARVRDGRGMYTKINGDGSASGPKPKQHKGRFAKVTESTPDGSSPRSKKPHRWSGGGADRDIVEAGRAFLPNGPSRQPSATSSVKVDSPKMHSRVGSTPWRDTDQSGKSRFKWVDGHFVPVHKDDVLRSPGTGLSRESEVSGLPNGRAFSKEVVNRREDDEKELPSVAHRSIYYKRADAPHKRSSSTGYAFLKDAVGHKPCDDVVAADLDFGKFVKKLRRELAFEQGRETLVCRDGDSEAQVTNEKQWHQVLGGWEARKSLGPLVFEVVKMHQSPQVKMTAKQPTAKSALGTSPNDHRKATQQSQPERSAIRKRKGVCICGKPAEGGRGCIACDNPGCARGTFHISCTGMEKRTMGWRCAECSPS